MEGKRETLSKIRNLAPTSLTDINDFSYHYKLQQDYLEGTNRFFQKVNEAYESKLIPCKPSVEYSDEGFYDWSFFVQHPVLKQFCKTPSYKIYFDLKEGKLECSIQRDNPSVYVLEFLPTIQRASDRSEKWSRIYNALSALPSWRESTGESPGMTREFGTNAVTPENAVSHVLAILTHFYNRA